MLLPSPSNLQTLLWAVIQHHVFALLPVLPNVAEVQCEDRENSLQVLQETENTSSRKMAQHPDCICLHVLEMWTYKYLIQ